MGTFYLKVIACDRTFFSGMCKQVIMPLEDGLLALEAHHENMVFAIEMGEIKIKNEDDSWITGIVGTGFAQVINNRVTIIVDTVEYPEEIDLNRAREAKERAEEQLRQKRSIQEYHHSQASLSRAMSRLALGSKSKQPK